jgi:hypothetical protein
MNGAPMMSLVRQGAIGPPAERAASAGMQEAERWAAGVADSGGDYRVVYTIDDAKRRVSVTRVRHRSEVYEG